MPFSLWNIFNFWRGEAVTEEGASANEGSHLLPQTSASRDSTYPSEHREDDVESQGHCVPRNRQGSWHEPPDETHAYAMDQEKELLSAGVRLKSETETKEMTFKWQDIDPPASYLFALRRVSFAPGSTPTIAEKQSVSTDTTLPIYNDVSGAVIVDWNGYPRFLTPEGEVKRAERLQRAVREKMLGLPKTEHFTWARPWHGNEDLPAYFAGHAHGKKASVA